jgi:hypothetical protein
MKDKKKKISICGPALARLFSASVIDELALKGHSTLAVSILKETGLLGEFNQTTLLRDFFNQVYTWLFRTYRNEYIYKNAIARKILLGVHSLNTTTMLTEFRAGSCKADVIVLNGTSTVYEIKSAYDSLDRLTRQIAAYRQLFDRINVITSDSQLDKVARVTGNDIGLMVLTDRNTIRTVQEPMSLKNTVHQAVIFDSLRKNEYEQIIKEHFGAVPRMPNARMYQSCRELFCSLNQTVAHDAMVDVIKKRGDSKRLRDFVVSVPESLTAVSLSCNLSVAGQIRFLRLLNMEIGNCLVG